MEYLGFLWDINPNAAISGSLRWTTKQAPLLTVEIFLQVVENLDLPEKPPWTGYEVVEGRFLAFQSKRRAVLLEGKGAE